MSNIDSSATAYTYVDFKSAVSFENKELTFYVDKIYNEWNNEEYPEQDDFGNEIDGENSIKEELDFHWQKNKNLQKVTLLSEHDAEEEEIEQFITEQSRNICIAVEGGNLQGGFLKDAKNLEVLELQDQHNLCLSSEFIKEIATLPKLKKLEIIFDVDVESAILIDTQKDTFESDFNSNLQYLQKSSSLKELIIKGQDINEKGKGYIQNLKDNGVEVTCDAYNEESSKDLSEGEEEENENDFSDNPSENLTKMEVVETSKKEKK